MDSQNLTTITNFYYCLLISILIHKKHATTLNPSKPKNHIDAWLAKTKRNKVFDKIVLSEILWLQEELPKRSCEQLESMLNKIYRACIKLQTSEEHYHQ